MTRTAPHLPTRTRQVARRFARRRIAVVSLVVLVVIVVVAFVVEPLWHYGYADITPDSSVPPSFDHPFGTDNLGHDAFAQVLRGIQRSLEISVLVALLSGVVGTVWGSLAGYHGGVVDSVMMRFCDLVLTLPLLAVAAVLGNATPGSWWLVAVVISGLSWAVIARVVRGVVLSIREKEFVEAARALGASDGRIIVTHVIPNVIGPVIVIVTILLSTAILTETALSYLGFGVHAPDVSLGLLVSSSSTAVSTRPWLFYFPGACIVAIALAVNFIGDGLRDALDPKQNRAPR
jgi:peptide/nickel transport system permease protein